MAAKHSIKHHYIAKGILKNFCFSRQTTYYTSKRFKNAEIKERNIETIFTRRHYNSFLRHDGSRDNTVEKFFAYELDNFIPEWISIFEAGIETGQFSFNDKTPRWRFVQFFYNHMKRSPDFLEPIVEKSKKDTFDENLFQEIQRDLGPLSNAQLEKILDPQFQERVTSNSRVQNISIQSLNILDTINSLKLIIATPIRANKAFICGGNPVVRFENYPKQKLGEKGVELWTTLTPKIAVGFANTDDNEQVITLDDTLVRRINLSLTKQSSGICGTSTKQLASLIEAAW